MASGNSHNRQNFDTSRLNHQNSIEKLDLLQKVFGEIWITNFRISSDLIRKVLESANEN